MLTLMNSAAAPPRLNRASRRDAPAVAPWLARSDPVQRILVVDDQHAIRALVRRILERHGYSVTTAADGADALESMKAAMAEAGRGAGHGIALVLTDLDMPRVGGRELGRELAARWPAVPVVYMSSLTAGVGGWMRLPGEHFIEKPFPADVLLLKIYLTLRQVAGPAQGTATVQMTGSGSSSPRLSGGTSPAGKKEGARMPSHLAFIERSNRKDLDHVEVQMTITESSAGRQSWSGEFVARSADGILPNERLALTLDTGQKGTARVSETRFDSRTPGVTVVHFTGTSPLA